MPEQPAVELVGVTKGFQSGQPPAVDDLTLAVPRGAILALLGPSGCGKTTTLRLIAGFERPDHGEITIDGRPVVGPQTWVPPEARGAGMVFQDYALFPHLTVADNVAFGLHTVLPAERVARTGAVLRLVGIEALAHRFPHELSGGQQQRVALARALAPQPVVILLDEPFSNLDADLREATRAEIARILRETGTTAIIVTHDQEEAFAVADLVAVMNAGRLEQVGRPEEIYHAPATRFVADFVGLADFLEGWVAEHAVVTEVGTFARNGFPEGSRVEVMLRPDDLVLEPGGGPAIIVSRQFRGAEQLYTIKLPSGRLIHVRQVACSIVPVGTRARLRPLREEAVTFPCDEVPPPD